MKKQIVVKLNSRIAMDVDTANRLNDAIHLAEGRATARTLDAKSAFDALKRAEKYLRNFSTVKDAIGTKVSIDISAQDFPRAYKYKPESTIFEAERTSSGWKITNIFRGNTFPSAYNMVFGFTEATIKNMSAFLSRTRR